MITNFSQAAAVVRDVITKKYPQINRAFVFGSFVENAQSSNSDLDVMVEVGDTMGLQFISMIHDLEKETGISVDVITMNSAHNLEQKYGYDILRRARLVYEKQKN